MIAFLRGLLAPRDEHLASKEELVRQRDGARQLYQATEAALRRVERDLKIAQDECERLIDRNAKLQARISWLVANTDAEKVLRLKETNERLQRRLDELTRASAARDEKTMPISLNGWVKR